MNRISVVLSKMPRLLRDIVVDAIGSAPDIEIAGEAHSAGELQSFLQDGHTDLVVAADVDPDFTAESQRLWKSRLRPKLLVVTESGGAAFLHCLRTETLPLGQLTPEGLLREIRTAARSDAS